MSDNTILVLNCGSSSIKFALFGVATSPLPREAFISGKVQGIGGPSPAFSATGMASTPLTLDSQHPHTAALAYILGQVGEMLGERNLLAVVHRVVHGGSRFAAPVRVTQEVIDTLRSYTPLAPLHQPFPLKAMSIILKQSPGLPQIACFDTAFHHTLPEVEQVLPLPYAAREWGIRRYGFHGLSYEYISLVLPEREPTLADGRVIVAHLGNGASLCALHKLKSVATTMGFSALDGLMMGTRTGSVDPGAILYLMEIEKLSLQEVSHLLYHESGLLGVSGISAEPRYIVEHENDDSEAGQRARLALALYVRRIVREVGALTAVLGGLDMLVFTAGVGENCAFIRERVCEALGFLDIRLNASANAGNAPAISAPDSAVKVLVEPTNEEWVAARHALAVLRH